MAGKPGDTALHSKMLHLQTLAVATAARDRIALTVAPNCIEWLPGGQDTQAQPVFIRAKITPVLRDMPAIKST